MSAKIPKLCAQVQQCVARNSPRAFQGPTLCDPMDCSLPGSYVHGIFQARILEWVTVSSSRDLPDLGIEPTLGYASCIGRQVLYH